MQTITETIPNSVVSFIEKLRAELCDQEFLDRHRMRRQDFTRKCQLTFPVVSTGAVTHARAKLKHTAFIELNTEVVVPAIYGEQPLKEIRRWRGHRLLGLDSSMLRLPNHPELFEQFTPVPINAEANIATKMYPAAGISVLYDLLNRVGLDGQMRAGSDLDSPSPQGGGRGDGSCSQCMCESDRGSLSLSMNRVAILSTGRSAA